jgi:hypothetical protein
LGQLLQLRALAFCQPKTSCGRHVDTPPGEMPENKKRRAETEFQSRRHKGVKLFGCGGMALL